MLVSKFENFVDVYRTSKIFILEIVVPLHTTYSFSNIIHKLFCSNYLFNTPQSIISLKIEIYRTVLHIVLVKQTMWKEQVKEIKLMYSIANITIKVITSILQVF